MGHQSIKLSTKTARESAKRLIDQSPDGYIALIGEETRSQAQNRMMWPLIDDLRAQIPAIGQFNADDTKLRLMDGLADELRDESRFLPKLDGGGMFCVGRRSSALTKSRFADLLAFILAYGARHGVRWSDRSYASFAEAGVPAPTNALAA